MKGHIVVSLENNDLKEENYATNDLDVAECS